MNKIKILNSGWLAHISHGVGLLALFICSVFSITIVNAADKPITIYAGRTQPAPVERYRVINQSSGYDDYAYNRRHRPQNGVNVQLNYQAPSTTTINNTVQIIPPSQGVGSVSYSQDNYYIYPPDNHYQHQHQNRRRYVQPYIDQSDDDQIQPIQNRNSQWTKDIGITPP